MKGLGLLSALLFLSALAPAASVSLTVGETAVRCPPVPRSLSGLTQAADGTFLAVADDARGGEVGLYRCSLRLSPDGGKIVEPSVSSGSVVRLEGAVDLEAVAYDPLKGTVWAADESQRTVKEYDLRTGRALAELPCSEMMRTNRGNLGFESLTISPDGLTLWTCNEEALKGDGPRSSPAAGTVVRLFKFVRADAGASWRPAGVYPYRTDKWRNPVAFGSVCRRGVADLTALSDGSLLVLERDLSFTASYAGLLSFSIFRVARPEDATDITDVASLSGGGWTPVAKSELASGSGALTAYGNFEGMCLGPRLADGRRSLVLVSDSGDGFSRPLFLPLVLSGVE